MLKNILLGFAFCGTVLGSQDSKLSPKFCSIIVPGQEELSVNDLKENNIIVTGGCYNCGTMDPKIMDFGQDKSINAFNHTFDTMKTWNGDWQRHKPQILLYGFFEGSATVGNWLAIQSSEIQKKIKCIFLGSVLATKNSVITRTFSHITDGMSLPVSNERLPQLVKEKFPAYNPDGKYLFDSVANLPTTIPVIIMHNIYDQQFSINDARELYCKIKKRNKSVYLFETNGRGDSCFDILIADNEKAKKIDALQAIYKEHNLPFNQECSDSAIDLKDLNEFMPSIDEVRKRIEAHTRQAIPEVKQRIEASTVKSFLVRSSIGAFRVTAGLYFYGKRFLQGSSFSFNWLINWVKPLLWKRKL